MLETLFILMCILNATNCWLLEVNQNKVTPQLTSNVTIECHHDVDDVISPIVVDIDRIRIIKYIDNNGWTTVAEITLAEPSLVKSSLTDAKTSGHIGTLNDTYIKMHFDIATDETLGQFECEVDGFDNRRDLKVVKTKRAVIVTEISISFAEVLKILIDIKNQGKQYNTDFKVGFGELKHVMETNNFNTSSILNNINSRVDTIDSYIHDLKNSVDVCEQERNMTSSTISNLTNHLEKVSSDLQTATARREQAETKMSSDIASLANKMNKINDNVLDLISPEWPTGTYTLLRTKSGCPSTLIASWQLSSLRVSTQPGNNNKDTSSNDFELAGDVFQNRNGNHYFNFEMCSKVTAGHGGEWPKGHYCIQVYSYNDHDDDSNCPSGFHYGYSHYGRYEDGSKDEVVNLPGYYQENNGGATYIPYCCRDDGPASNPITLPRQRPFILFRFGGECQMVDGMIATKQWIHLDVGKWGSTNGHNNIYHPDGDVTNGFRLEFCYYTPT